MKTNFHTHSTFCDGTCSILTMAQTARDHRFSMLGFSGHAPLPFPTDWNMKQEDIPRYYTAIQEARELIGQDLTLVTGLEIDYIEGMLGPQTVTYPEITYSIGSVHYINPKNSKQHTDLFAVDEKQDDFDRHIQTYCNGDYEQAVSLYYKSLYAMISAGGFTILGHLDLIKKNNPRQSRFSETSSFYKDAVMHVVDALQGTNIVVEINTGGLARGKTQEVYPAHWILKELHERNVPICLNADAHAPEHLYAYYDHALRAALEAGYTKQVVPSMHGLITVSLTDSQ
ncbi:MAG TPA: histidinol-phosphatase [Spirochaetales bacterium]|nr:histidinol-phosphatase [Spirochaetales bacterium]HOT59076.1 histidinol-phosphatase [Spirochaetales bacterium]HQK34613.1 histidinol-phosphatase [Spirochaetales bacterium]HRV27804.1 histidinol-phosphatase [Spirochaetia bacterium]